MDRRPWVTAAAVAAALLLASCEAGGATPPTPSGTPSSSAGVASPSPSASSTGLPIQEQMRKDVEAARQAYIDSFNEMNRLEMAGGAKKPTKALRQTMSGEFLKAAMNVLRDDKKRGISLNRPGKLLGFSMGAWTEHKIRVTACEDFSSSDWLDADGEIAIDGEPGKYIQRTVALKGDDGRWRIDHGKTTKVEDFETAECNQGGV